MYQKSEYYLKPLHLIGVLLPLAPYLTLPYVYNIQNINADR